VNIWQNAEANGGDAEGGDGGDGGSAAAASAESEGEGDATASASVSVDPNNHGSRPNSNLNQPPEAQSLGSITNVEDAAAKGGDGGNGGDATGGDGGTATNVAEVEVENVVVIYPNSDGSTPLINLGVNGNNLRRNVDIKVDENGNTFVNGQKRDEQELNDGTKVFIFRNSELKTSKKKDK